MTWNKPVKIPEVGKPEDVIYYLTIHPFEGEVGVSICFAWARPKDPQDNGWVPHILNIGGPQVDGIDLDETFTKIGPFLWSYRQYIYACLVDILNFSFQGKSGVEADYLDMARPWGKNLKIVYLDG